MTGGAFKLLRARKRQAITPQGTRVTGNVREKGEVLGLGEVFQVLAPFDKGVVLEVLLHAQMVQVVGV